MAQDGSVESRAHAGARAGTWSGPWPWPVGGIRPPWHGHLATAELRPQNAVAAMGRPRNCRRPAAALARGRLRLRHRHLLHRGTRAGVVGGDGTGSGLCRRRGIAAPASGRFHRRPFCFRRCRGLCRRHGEDRHDRTSGAALSGLGRDDRGLRRIARGKPAHRPLRAARRAHRRRPHRRQAAARAALGQAGAGAARGLLRRSQGDARSAAAAAGAGLATISPAIFISSRSAPRASCAARSR